MDNELQPIQIKITTSGANESVKSINSVTSALKELQNVAKISTNLMSNFGNTITKNKISNTFNVGNTISQTSESSKKASKNIKHFSTNLAKLGITFWSVNKSAKMLRQAMDESASWVENLNVMEVAFGSMSESAYKFARTTASGLGLNENQMLEYVSLFQQMASAMGQTTETAYMMSTSLTLLGTDIASLYNKDTRVTMEALRSAIAGQVKPVRQFGLDITSYSIDALIEEMGILSGYTSRMMTQAQKQLARTILLIEKSRNSWGDLAKTLNTYSNQQKILQAQFTNLKRAIGDFFVGTGENARIATRILYVLNGVMMAIVETIRAFIPEVKSSGFNEMGESAKDAKDDLEDLNEELNSSLLSFDKFNTLSSGENKGNDYITLALQNKLAKEYSDYMAEWNSRMEKVESTAHKIRDSIMEWLGFVKNVSTYTKLIREETEDTPAIYAEYTEVQFTLKDGITTLGVAKTLLISILSIMTAMKTINVFGNLTKSLNVVNLAKSGEMLTDALNVNKISGGWAILSKSLFPIKSLITSISPMALGIGAAIIAISGSLMYLYKTNEDFRNSVNELLSTLKELFMGIVEPIANAIKDLMPTLKELATNIFGVIGQTLQAIAPILSIIVKLLSDVLKLISPILSAIIKIMSLAITPIIKSISNMINVLVKSLEPLLKIMETLGKIVEWVFNMIRDISKSSFSQFIEKIRSIFNSFETTLRGRGNTLFANGGYPDRGQMFIANENGAELVGNIGGRTAVANNDMITQAIEDAAYNGMIRATTSTNGTNNINLRIDANSNDLSRALAKSMIMEFQRQGYNLKG